MKRILLLIILAQIGLFAQTHDIRAINKFVTVIVDDTTLIAEFFPNQRIETNQTIYVNDSLQTIDTNYIPKLPPAGTLIEKDKLYLYGSKVYRALQSFIMTNFPPDLTPNLFNTWRAETDSMEWIPNEKVFVGNIRYYDGIAYECIQEHVTQSDWIPPNTPSLWKEQVPVQTCPVWVQPTGSQDAYNIGDCVSFNGNCYESTIDSNVWSPQTYPQGWRQIPCP